MLQKVKSWMMMCVVLWLVMNLLVGCNFGEQNDFNVFVSGYEGEVLVLRDEQLIPVVLGMPLEIGDYVRVSKDAHVQLLFGAGALVVAQGGSELILPNAQVVRLIQGETFYYVEPQQVNSFVVKTDRIDIEVVGTQFLVAESSDSTLVALLSGSIQAKSEQEVLMLRPGEQLIVNQRLVLEQSEITEQVAKRILVMQQHLGIFDSEKQDELEVAFERELAILRDQLDALEQELALVRIKLSESQERSQSFEQLYNNELAKVERYKQLVQQLNDGLV